MDALRTHAGQVATTAHALGLRRNQLRRWLARHEVDPKEFGRGDTDPVDEPEEP